MYALPEKGIEIRAAEGRPGQMAGDEDGVELVDQPAHACEVDAVEAVGASDRDADRVNGDGVGAGEICQQLGPVWISQEILRMDLEPPDGWASGHHLRNVRKPKADTGPFSRVQARVTGDGHGPVLPTSA